MLWNGGWENEILKVRQEFSDFPLASLVLFPLGSFGKINRSLPLDSLALLDIGTVEQQPVDGSTVPLQHF